MSPPKTDSVYSKIYTVVGRIPRGRVATYGQIAGMVDRCTARMVGYAMAAVPSDTDVPWHRVINSQGKVSPRSAGDGSMHQRLLLEAEGLHFDKLGRVDLKRVAWRPRRRRSAPSTRSS